MAKDLLSISEVVQLSGLQSSALRYYERAGLIASRGRASGRRQFGADVLQRLAAIALLQEVGFTISEIAELTRRSGGQKRWRALAEEKLEEIDSHLGRVREARELLTSALACECTRLDDCELVSQRRGRHRRAVQTLSLRMGPPPG